MRLSYLRPRLLLLMNTHHAHARVLCDGAASLSARAAGIGVGVGASCVGVVGVGATVLAAAHGRLAVRD